MTARRGALFRFGVACVGLFSLSACNDDSGPTAPGNPADARIETGDIPRFWAAIDKGGSADAFQREYLDRASPGLRSFARRRSITAASLARTVAAYPRYIAGMREASTSFVEDPAVLASVGAAFEAIERLYPAATFPTVTLAVGRFSAAGTISEEGILIGSEFFSRGPTTPIDELEPFHRDNVRPPSAIDVIVSHEHVHVLQAPHGLFGRANATLLEQALIEGIADFLSHLVTGARLNPQAWAWGLAHEAELWEEFQAEMHGRDWSRWLYNQGTSTERPGDLGYFIGARIAESWWERSLGSQAAPAAMIEMSDAAAFLAESRYDPQREP